MENSLRTSTLILVIIASIAISGAHSDSITSDDESISKFTLEVPLYEKYYPFNNYILNQSIEQALRWTSLGAIGGGLVGFAISPKKGRWAAFDQMLYSAIGALSVGGTGLIAGTSYGIFKGAKLNKTVNDTIRSHIKRDRFGYMYTMFSASLPAFRSPYIISRWHETDVPGIFLIYRDLNNDLFRPDFYSFGFYEDYWGTRDAYEELTEENASDGHEAKFSRFELNSCFRLTDWQFFEPMVGVGGGYVWGRERVARSDRDVIHRTFFLHLSLDGQANLFDFLFSLVECKYEIIGLHRKLKGNYPYIGNFYFRWSFGTYIL